MVDVSLFLRPLPCTGNIVVLRMMLGDSPGSDSMVGMTGVDTIGEISVDTEIVIV